jgi:hypothetical protein
MRELAGNPAVRTRPPCRRTPGHGPLNGAPAFTAAEAELDDIWYSIARESGSIDIAGRLIDSHHREFFPYRAIRDAAAITACALASGHLVESVAPECHRHCARFRLTAIWITSESATIREQ